jgi:hypothetical protein
MKTTPILMTGGNIRLIQQGLKTNTRRVCMARTQNEADIIGGAIMDGMCSKPDDGRHEIEAWKNRIKCPYGAPGDLLAIKETFWAWGEWFQRPDHSKPRADAMRWEWLDMTNEHVPILYDADMPDWYSATMPKIERGQIGYHKRPAIYLPKTAWRIKLEITRVDVERLQDISEGDCIAEGCPPEFLLGKNWYCQLWDSINGTQRPGKPDISWAANPFVWSIHFKKLS